MIKPENNKQQNCPLCFPEDSQIVRIMYGLVKLILKQNKTSIVEKRTVLLTSQDEKNSNSDSSINKFINFLFYSKLELRSDCKHILTVQFLQKKTNLPKNKITAICEFIYNSHAKRNYQLQILSNQIKYFPKTISEELNRKHKQIQHNSQKQLPASQSKIESFKTQLQLTNVLATESQVDNQPVIFMPYYLPSIHELQFTSFYNQPVWSFPVNTYQ